MNDWALIRDASLYRTVKDHKNLLNAMTIFILFSLTAHAADSRDKQLTTVRGIAIRDCTCETWDWGDPDKTVEVKKAERVGDACETVENGKQVLCSSGYMTRIGCPRDCIQLKSQPSLTDSELKNAAKSFIDQSARTDYQRQVPQSILKAIQAKFPNWLPTVFNRYGPFLAKYTLLNKYYLETELVIGSKSEPVSIVFFFRDMDHLLERRMDWSFWKKSSGELIHESIAPYLAYHEGYEHIPCLSPAGKNLDRVVLYGFAAGESDIGGCCGPYSLSRLAEQGPIKAEADPELAFDQNVISSFCGKVNDPNIFFEIDGPANIRKVSREVTLTKDNQLIPPPPPDKSEIIGTCKDHSRGVGLGWNGDWINVYCEGKSGWTHKKNIRPTKTAPK